MGLIRNPFFQLLELSLVIIFDFYFFLEVSPGTHIDNGTEGNATTAKAERAVPLQTC
jgi:hypothetical protein